MDSTRVGRRGVRALGVLLVGAIAVGALAVAAAGVHRRSQRELLHQRASEASAALRAVLPAFQVPLSSAVAVAQQGNTTESAFRRIIGGFLGDAKLLQSASLWSVGATPGGDPPRPLVQIGRPSKLAARPDADLAARLGRAPQGGIGIVDLLAGKDRALGFTLASEPVDGRRIVAYLEARLPDDPTALDLTGDAFDDLDYAVYLGPRVRADKLLVATTRQLPLRGSHERQVVRWGDTDMQLAFSPRGELGDHLLGRLPWIILAIGGVLTLAFTWLTWRLDVALRAAAGRAETNQQRFLAERSVALTLQRDLLPDRLPEHPAMALAHRYQAGAAGVEVGGDWYDAVLVDDDHLLLTVGDVSGQGLSAAHVMMSLRLAVRAFASEGDGPGAILAKLNPLLDVRSDGHFATVLCACFERSTGRLVAASAGHPPPVVLRGGRAVLEPVPVGLPIGVDLGTYPEVTIDLPPGATVVAFTDGLFERRGEHVDEGLERVRATVERLADLPLPRLVDQLTETLQAAAAPDDTAVLALRSLGEPTDQIDGRWSPATSAASSALASGP